MTKLISPYPNVTVYANKTGKIIARHKPGPNPKIKTHPQYENTRRNMAVLGKAASAGKLIRYLFNEPLHSISDPLVSGRLTGRLHPMFRSGINENYGPGCAAGDISPLEGFSFNARAGIYECFLEPWSLSLENNNKRVGISIPPIIPTRSIRNPNGGCACYRLVPYIAAIDFTAPDYKLVKPEPAEPVRHNDQTSKEITLTADIGRPGNWLVLIALGIEFYWCGPNNQFCPVAGGTHNALTITNTFTTCVS